MVPDDPGVINGKRQAVVRLGECNGKYIMTYTELVQKIRDYTEVTSTVLTDTIVNGFYRGCRV